MIRQPPPAVPAAITSAHMTLIQSAIDTLCPGSGGGTSRNESQPGRFANRPAAVADASARATIPIVFCASFVPCMSPMPMALNNWALPKNWFTLRGFQLRSSAYSSPMTVNPSTNPSSGDANIGITTFHSSPLLGYQCAASGTDQMTTLQLRAAATAAPTSPPTNAWLELLGSPACQVTRFQMIAPSSAQISTSCDATFGSTSPEAIVEATAVPHIAPIRFVEAAITTACRGVRTRVATIVAIELAVSWNPLMYSNTSAIRITTKINAMLLVRASGVFEYDVRNGVAAIAAAVDCPFEQIVQVADHQGRQRLELAAIGFTQEVEHQVVCLALDTLQTIVHRLHGFQRWHLPQQANHLRERLGRPLHELYLPGEVNDLEPLRGQIES